MATDEEKEIEKMLENEIDMNPDGISMPHEVDVADEEEKSIEFTD